MEDRDTLSEFSSGGNTDDSDSRKSSKETYKNAEWLREQYHGKNRATTEIADEIGVSVSTICNWLDKHNINTKSNLVAQTDSDAELLENPEWLRTEYTDKGRSCKDIGDDIGVSDTTIRNWLKKHGIDRRSASEARAEGNVKPLHNSDWLREQYVDQHRSTYDIAEELDISKSAVSDWLDRHNIEKRGDLDAFGKQPVDELKDEEWLREQYVTQERSTYDIADELGVVKTTVANWMRKHGIEFRSSSERVAKGNITPLKDEDWLSEQYVNQERSMDDIAEDLDLSQGAVQNWLENHGIDRRSGHDALTEGNLEPLRNRDWLQKQYEEKGRSTYNIADELGVARGTVSNWLDRHAIDTRGDTEAFGSAPVEELQDAEWLYQQYHEHEKSSEEIASEVDVAPTTVANWMHKHEIEFRSHLESLTTGNIEPLRDADWLHEQYIEKQRAMTDIANELDVSAGTVRDYLGKHNIQQRSFSAEFSDGNVEPLHDSDWLHEQYVEMERTTTDIASELGVATGTVSSWIKKHEIGLRTVSESKADGDVTPLHDPDWLRTEYTEKMRTPDDISKQLGVAPGTVYQWLKRHEIELRGLHYPDHLNHLVRSDWELTVADLLVEEGIEYGYESLEITYDDGRTYTPDFVTDSYVIEVKGRVYKNRDVEQKAVAAMDQLENREYVVVGTELPADHHIPWEDRRKLRRLFD